jgi:phage-related protein
VGERLRIPIGPGVDDRVRTFARRYKSRMKGRSGIARALYVTLKGRRLALLRVFVKKTPKTPRREIKLALQRAEGLE